VAAGAALALALTMSAAKMKQFWNHAQRNKDEQRRSGKLSSSDQVRKGKKGISKGLIGVAARLCGMAESSSKVRVAWVIMNARL
jgi:hypothetical protein